MLIRLIIWITTISCITSCSISQKENAYTEYITVEKRMTLVDPSRDRTIPIAIYSPVTEQPIKNQKIVIFSHGYGKNNGIAYLGYTFITDFLASRGYLVVSVQHELPDDPRLPKAGSGNMRILRHPFWDRGANNIHFVLKTLKKNYPNVDSKNVTLIGHSNGGDMSALYPKKFPNEVKCIITLDNKRMPLPKSKKIKVLSLRSKDQHADKGVLPTAKEKYIYKIKVVQLRTIVHDDMCNNATAEQRKHMLKYIIGFMKD